MNSDVLDTTIGLLEAAIASTESRIRGHEVNGLKGYSATEKEWLARYQAALAEVARLREADGDLREGLARYAHEAWSGWMKYMFEKCDVRWAEDPPYMNHKPARVLMIPPWAVERWSRQMSTPYADLPEQEKESDRQEADRMIAIMRLREAGPQPNWIASVAQELDVIGTALSKSREEIALDLRDCDEEFRVGYMVLLGEIDDAVAALASLRERQQAGPQWEPVGDLYMQESANRPIDRGGRLVVNLFVTSGRMIRLEDSDNNQISWLFRDDYAVCRRTQAGRQDGK